VSLAESVILAYTFPAMLKLLLKRGLPALILIIILCIGTAYGLLHSDRFITTYLLPMLSRQLGQSLTADQVQIRPLRGLSLKELRINCEGSEKSCPANQPFSLRIGSLEAAYDFWALFSRQLHITLLKASEVHISVTNGLDEPDPTQTDELSETQKEAVSSSEPNGPGFTFRLSNAALEGGSFLLTSHGSPDRYSLEQVAIEIPEAHSHQDGKVRITTRASIRSDTISLENQPISLEAILRESTLFMPSRLDLEFSGGASSPRPIDLRGSLQFNKAPYSLTKLTLHKGLVRHSLLEILAIPSAPLQEFEYALQGDYTPTSPAKANIALAVQKNVFMNGAIHDLKGTSLDAGIEIASNKVTLSDGAITVIDNSSTILSSSVNGAVSLSPFSHPSTIALHASLVNFDQIRALLHDVLPPSTPPDARHDSKTPADATPVRPEKTSTTPLQLPIGSLDARIDKLVVQNIETTSFAFGAKIPSPRTIETASLNAAFPQGGVLSMNAAGSLDSTLSFRASGKNVNMIPFAGAASGPKGEILEGSLKALDVNLNAHGSDIRKTLQGHATISLSRLIVPSTLQEQIPFNILFLPLDALITVFGGTLNMLLPASISSISDSIRQTLDDAGRLGIDNSIVDLRFEKGRILLKNVDINTKNLPDFTFKGSITPEDRLDLTVFIALLKLNLPLPIAGTMTTPLPDVMYLGPELVRGLGLSIGSLAGSAVSIVGGGSTQPDTQSGNAPES
jgi:hypothetical protein